MKLSENTPKIYVGTYGIYNNGSLYGKWFDLSDYTDSDELFKDCYEYHRNEFFSSGCRPELMFQDWEYIPSFLISESNLHQDTFKYFEAVSEMDDDRAEAFEIYCSDIIPGQPTEMIWKKHWKVLKRPIRDIMEEISKIRKQSLLTSMLRIPECFREHLKFLKDILTMMPSGEIYFLKAIPKPMDLSLLIDKHPKLQDHLQ